MALRVLAYPMQDNGNVASIHANGNLRRAVYVL